MCRGGIRPAGFLERNKMEYKIKVNITLKDYKSFIFDNIMQKKISLIFSLCLILIGFIITFVDFILTRNYSIYMNIFFIYYSFSYYTHDKNTA